MKLKRNGVWAFLGLLCTAMWMTCLVVDSAEARAGGGRSSGFRGSRSTAPPRPAYTPPPSKPQTAPPPGAVSPGQQQQRPGMGTPAPAQSPGMGSFGRGLAGGLAGGLLGGMIGNMLFGGSGHAGPGGAPAAGGGCSSIGLFDIILIGGLLYLGYRMLNRRRQAAFQGAEAGGGGAAIPVPWQSEEPGVLPVPDVQGELEAIRRSDPGFDEAAFKEMAQDLFFKLQGAWMRQDPALLKELATPEFYDILHSDLKDLQTRGQINRLENIAVRKVEITEAWQDPGQDFITVHFLANLLDYTVDANTNLVLSGSDKEPVKFEEYWTFTRPAGTSGWKLSGIHQPEG